MKKIIAIFTIAIIAQTVFTQETQDTVMQMDEAVKILARSIHSKLTEKRAEKVIIGQFVFQDRNTSFSSFWINQLTSELVNTSGRNYSVLSLGASDAEWTITGEIISASDTIRVFTKIIRASDKAIEGSFISNFRRSEQIANMLAFTGAGSSSNQGGGGSDPFEPDSWENPVTYTIGTSSQSAEVINRVITEGDEDFFLLFPDRDGRLTMETTGSAGDPYMHFYNYETEEELAEDDDGGQDNNARIVQNVRAGTRYIAMVRGYSSSSTGAYGFRAYMTVREGASSFENPISYEIRNGEDNAVSLRRTLQEGDEDFFLLIPERDGRLTIETTGRTDTYLEFFDSDKELLAEDDDGGQSNNARLRQNVRAGNRYYAMVRGYSSGVSGAYSFRAYFPGGGTPGRDDYEPDDEPDQAKTIEVGTSQERTFHSANDVDWIKFEVSRAGRFVITAKGANSNRLDTYLELFDSNLNLIAEDDDGGDSLTASISRNLTRGTYYIKARCLDEEPDQGYILTVEAQN